MTQPAENNNRKTLIVGIGVVLLLVVAIAVAAARGTGETPVAENPAETPLESPASTSTPPASIPGTGSAAATGTAAANGAKPGSPGKQGSLPAPDSAAPKAPAAAGSQLTTLTVPPEKTIGMIVVPDGFRIGTYEITFKPYGWGPAGQQGGRLVAQIVSAKATDEGAKSLKKEFDGRNATLWCAGPIAEEIKLGGQYKGVMVVRPQGDVGVLYLTEAQPTK